MNGREEISMIIKRKAISGKLKNTWIRMRGIKKGTCNNCSHKLCRVPILTYSRKLWTVSQLRNRCIGVVEDEVFYVLVLSDYASKIKKNLQI